MKREKGRKKERERDRVRGREREFILHHMEQEYLVPN